jgi:hypothetical protein
LLLSSSLFLACSASSFSLWTWALYSAISLCSFSLSSLISLLFSAFFFSSALLLGLTGLFGAVD